MQRFKNTTTASKNIRYKKLDNTSSYTSGDVFCEVCGSKMVMDMYGMYHCSNCEKEQIIDNQVF